MTHPIVFLASSSLCMVLVLVPVVVWSGLLRRIVIQLDMGIFDCWNVVGPRENCGRRNSASIVASFSLFPPFFPRESLHQTSLSLSSIYLVIVTSRPSKSYKQAHWDFSAPLILAVGKSNNVLSKFQPRRLFSFGNEKCTSLILRISKRYCYYSHPYENTHLFTPPLNN